MTTLRFLGCKGGTSLVKSRDFQADSALLIDGTKRVMVNCGEDWTDKVSYLNPDVIFLTSPEPEHAYGIQKADKRKVCAYPDVQQAISPLFNFEKGEMLKYDQHDIGDVEWVSSNQTSVLFKVHGKTILYAPEFCPDDMNGFRNADMVIGSGFSLKDNVAVNGQYSKRKYVSMLNQIALCKKYGIEELIFTGFGEECIRMGTDAINKAIAPHIEGMNVALATHGFSMEINEYEEVIKSIQQPFGSPGGKRFMLKHLMKFMPEHTTYVECFMGGGSLFFKKDPSPKEVVCDRDPEIFFLYKYIQTCTDEDLANLEKFNWKSSKKQFENLKAEQSHFVEKAEPAFNFDSPEPETPEEDPNKLTPGQNESKNKRFYRLMYLKRFSDVGFMKTYNKLTEGKSHTICSRITPVRDRLKDVKIMNDSYENAITQNDAPDTFHFIDPPYPNAQYPWKYQIDPQAMQEVLKAIKGKFLVTYEKQGRNIFTGFYQRFIKLRSQANPWRGVINKTELLVANYPFDNKSKVREPKT